MQKTLGRPFAPWAQKSQKDLLHPPLTTFGDFPFLGNFPGPQHPNDREPLALRDLYAYNLIRWAIFRLQDVEKQRERRKTKAKKGKGENEDKTLKHEKPPHQVRGVFLGHF